MIVSHRRDNAKISIRVSLVARFTVVKYYRSRKILRVCVEDERKEKIREKDLQRRSDLYPWRNRILVEQTTATGRILAGIHSARYLRN